VSTTSKSPNAVAAEALAVAREALPPYSHLYSPKKYTQHQLFACLVLKKFFKTDYRGIAEILRDSGDLRRILALEKVPHWTTLQKASVRLLRQGPFRRLFTATVRRHYGRRRRVKRAAVDSSGLAASRASRYYVRRRQKNGKDHQHTKYTRYMKMELVVDTADHFILGALSSQGPAPDNNRFVPLLSEAQRNMTIVTALADAGYDGEPNHQWARDQQSIRSVIPASIGRPTDKPPTGRYRRLMKQHLNKDYCQYGQRWQGETTNAIIKARQGDSLAARTHYNRTRETRLISLTHNILILYATSGSLQSRVAQNKG
jgi:hypothetical protein